MNKEEKISLALYLIEQTRTDAEEICNLDFALDPPKIGNLLKRIIANADILEGLVTGEYSKLGDVEIEHIPQLESV